MYAPSYLLLIAASIIGIANADGPCTSSNAIIVENLSPSATGPGGRSNSVVISLGQGLTKAGIQNLKKKRHGGDSGGSKDGGGGGGGGDGGHNSRTGISDLDCSTTGSGLETCYSIQSVPFCYNYATGSFHSAKLSGNALTGNYTLIDGQTGNLSVGPYPTRTGSTVSPGATTTSDHGGGGGNDDNRKTATATFVSSVPTTNSTTIATTSGISTTGGVLTTTLAATQVATVLTSGSVVVTTATSSPTQAAANGAVYVKSPGWGLLGILLSLAFV